MSTCGDRSARDGAELRPPESPGGLGAHPRAHDGGIEAEHIAEGAEGEGPRLVVARDPVAHLGALARRRMIAAHFPERLDQDGHA
jgi:hypothetical protein